MKCRTEANKMGKGPQPAAQELYRVARPAVKCWSTQKNSEIIFQLPKCGKLAFRI